MCESSVYKICAKIIFIYCIYDIIKKIFLFKGPKNLTVKKPIIFNNGTNKLINLLTPWGESLDKNNVLQEYPRPQFVRDSYLNLNGEWEYALEVGKTKPNYVGKIIVPFSIESPLSGVNGKSLQPGKTLWYRRYVDLTKIKNKGRFLLHFGAVDQYTKVFVNNKKVGEHDGGYTSFFFDITNYLKDDLSKTKIVVRVEDNYTKDGAAIGKQGKPRRGVFYVQTGGIWQTVWIESVPRSYIKEMRITPNYDEHSVSFVMLIDGDENYKHKKDQMQAVIRIMDSNLNYINSTNILAGYETNITINKDFRSWSPEDPYLYKTEYVFGEDVVTGYFGMRKFSIGTDKKGINRLFLNNKPYFQKGVLDQGYWSDGYYTAPSDEAIIYDIKTMKNMGFNMLRKHIKIEPLRWYYHCDTIGMLVWQDQPSGGNFPYNMTDEATFVPDDDYEFYSRKSEIGRMNYMRDLYITMANLFSVTSICTWVPFNEGWGQFESVKIANIIKDIDRSRFVDHASGWVDHFGPDFKSLHIYYEDIKFKPDELKRPIVLSEYGGYGSYIENHVGCKSQFSYVFFTNRKALTKAIKKLIKREVYPNIEKGLCASVYTQLSDVEGEINGFLTYDRKVIKVDMNVIKKANDFLKYLIPLIVDMPIIHFLMLVP